MPRMDITNTKASNMTNVFDDYEIDAQMIDEAGQQKETEYINSKWSTYWGYFNSVPDLKSAILMKAIWNVGKGYEVMDKKAKGILEKLRGWGKDTFNDIIFNMEVMRRVCGDSFAEIIRDEKTGEIINLKPLNPGTMKIVVNKKGQIIRYEEINRINDKNKVVNTFLPEQIFHLSNNRLANQIHGISDIESLEPVIKAEESNFEDMVKVAHRQARPMIMFKLKTDDTTKIDAFISKMDDAHKNGENIYIPDDENLVSYEVIQVNVSQVLMEWRNDIRNKFYRTIGLPQVVPGQGGKSTESESKVIYLAFEQIVEKEQRYLEAQILKQLGLEINFVAPTSLSPEMQADQAKDTGQLKPQLNPAGTQE